MIEGAQSLSFAGCNILQGPFLRNPLQTGECHNRSAILRRDLSFDLKLAKFRFLNLSSGLFSCRVIKFNAQITSFGSSLSGQTLQGAGPDKINSDPTELELQQHQPNPSLAAVPAKSELPHTRRKPTQSSVFARIGVHERGTRYCRRKTESWR